MSEKTMDENDTVQPQSRVMRCKKYITYSITGSEGSLRMYRPKSPIRSGKAAADAGMLDIVKRFPGCQSRLGDK